MSPHTSDWDAGWVKPVFVSGLNKRGFWIDYPEGLKVGDCADISKFVYLQCKYGVDIGEHAEIGSFTAVLSESSIDEKVGKVIIREHAKVGAHCTVMPNTIMQKYSLLAANSFLQAGTTIGEREIWGGTPARKIGTYDRER